MHRLGAVILLIVIAISASVGSGEAAWKKRGWYMKKEGVTCVMRKVTVVNSEGKVVVQKVRVCG